MSKLETNTIDNISGSSTLTIGSTNTSAISVGSPISNGLTLSDNILFDTASKGIYLGVTTATATNLLDDYEEGTWTPTAYSGITGLSVNGSQNTYTKVGRLVTVYCEINSFTGKGSGTLQIGGLPFTPDNNSRYLHGAIDSDSGSLGVSRTNSTTGRITFYRAGSTNSSRQVFIGNNLGNGARISLTYFAA
jgi:hypothetical protein|tara:strand:- start:105 stop:677 length:573 start_codon:yes stop_codon:yes gene_type:complete